MTLLEFITARLDEDEATARAAGDGRWRVDHWLDPRSSCPTGCSCRRVEGLDFTVFDEGGHDEAQAEHMARHDPARVLREVEARHRTLIRHRRDPQGACIGCGWSGDLDEPRTDAAEECPELLDMASVWSDHAEYLTEWSPS